MATCITSKWYFRERPPEAAVWPLQRRHPQALHGSWGRLWWTEWWVSVTRNTMAGVLPFTLRCHIMIYRGMSCQVSATLHFDRYPNHLDGMPLGKIELDVNLIEQLCVQC
jgi:hypothetical protein